MYQVDNAIIMAAGTSSRFAPLSYEYPKSLTVVKGEVLIERQIKQLKAAGIKEIILVVGYKKECFEYLKDKYGVILVENNDYLTRNNNASIHYVRDYLKNSYICSSDNYFSINPFETEVEDSYYAALYSKEYINEWCMKEDEEGNINAVKVGDEDTWYMMGHTFWSEDFSKAFLEVLDEVYDLPETANLLWEAIFMEHLDKLKMKIRRYKNEDIYEFDTLDELRLFDTDYVNNTHSKILKDVAKTLNCKESELVNIRAYKDKDNAAAGFTFDYANQSYKYNYAKKGLINE